MPARGLIVSPPIEFLEDGAVYLPHGTNLDLQELRFSLLFWDRLEYPAPQPFFWDSGPEGNYLEECNILQRTRWNSGALGMGPDVFRKAHVGVFAMHEKNEPGKWSVASGPRSVSFNDADLIPARGALVELHHAIPVPDKDVPLQDILEFRFKHAAELQALRHHLEAIYQRVLAAGDGPLAIRTEAEALQSAIVDQIRISKESGLKFRPVSLNASLNLYKGTSVTAGAFSLGLSAATALLAGAVASISIGPGTALSWGNTTGTPFLYVAAYHNEVF